MSEHDMMRLILARLNLIPGVLAWRQNTGAARTPSGGFVRFGVPGQADITGLLPGGRRLEIEVKAPGGRTTREQDTFGARILEHGGVYIVARTLDEALACVR